MRNVRVCALTIILVLGLAGSAGAAAATTKVLTKAEYQQLQLAQKRIHSLASSNAHSFAKANAVCTRMRDVSPLITAVRTGCLELITLGADDGKLNARATKCGIDPASEAALLSCLVPAVLDYYRDAEAFYKAEVRVDRLAAARGFSSRCIAVIGDSPGNLAAEGRLAADLKSGVQALRTQNSQALQTLFDQIKTDIDAIKPGPSSLTLCPHA